MFVGGAQVIVAGRIRPGELQFSRFGAVELDHFGDVRDIVAAGASLDDVANIYFRNHFKPAIGEQDARFGRETAIACRREILHGLLAAPAAAPTANAATE